MKLNNNGWGLREMVFFSSILLLFLLLVVILIMQLYNEFDESVDKSTPVVEINNSSLNIDYYHNKEYEVKEAARNYVQDFNPELTNGSINIFIDALINAGYLNYFADHVTGDYCDGYVKVYEENEVKKFNSYIKCDNYKTEGYVG